MIPTWSDDFPQPTQRSISLSPGMMQDPSAGPSHQFGGGSREGATSDNGTRSPRQPQSSATTRVRSAAAAPKSRLSHDRPAYVSLNEQAFPPEPAPPVPPSIPPTCRFQTVPPEPEERPHVSFQPEDVQTEVIPPPPAPF